MCRVEICVANTIRNVAARFSRQYNEQFYKNNALCYHDQLFKQSPLIIPLAAAISNKYGSISLDD